MSDGPAFDAQFAVLISDYSVNEVSHPKEALLGKGMLALVSRRGQDSDGWVATSVILDECGLSPDGIALCHWRLTLSSDGTFTWLHSDVGEAGDYTCSGTTITGQRPGGPIIAGEYDPRTERLTWDRVVYTRTGAGQ